MHHSLLSNCERSVTSCFKLPPLDNHDMTNCPLSLLSCLYHRMENKLRHWGMWKIGSHPQDAFDVWPKWSLQLTLWLTNTHMENRRCSVQGKRKRQPAPGSLPKFVPISMCCPAVTLKINEAFSSPLSLNTLWLPGLSSLLQINGSFVWWSPYIIQSGLSYFSMVRVSFLPLD